MSNNTQKREKNGRGAHTSTARKTIKKQNIPTNESINVNKKKVPSFPLFLPHLPTIHKIPDGRQLHIIKPPKKRSHDKNHTTKTPLDKKGPRHG